VKAFPRKLDFVVVKMSRLPSKGGFDCVTTLD
jgi:hypothetical protein